MPVKSHDAVLNAFFYSLCLTPRGVGGGGGGSVIFSVETVKEVSVHSHKNLI